LTAGNDVSDMFMNPNYGIFPQTGEMAYDWFSVLQPATVQDVLTFSVGSYTGHLDPVLDAGFAAKDAYNAYSDFTTGHPASGIMEVVGAVASAVSVYPPAAPVGAAIATGAGIVDDVGKALHLPWF